MANLNIKWTLPTTKSPSGLPLDVSEIEKVVIELSADLGESYAVIGEYTPDTLETTVQDLPPGEWYVRGSVIDTAGRPSKPKVVSIAIVDDSGPGELQTLVLTVM